MRIGELAKQTGTSVELIRHYEKIELLNKPARSVSDQRIYKPAHLNQLKVIRQLRALDFSLKEISLLFEYQTDPSHHTKKEVKTLVNRHVSKLDELLENLTTTRNYLLQLKDKCDGSDESAEHCPILEDLVINKKSR